MGKNPRVDSIRTRRLALLGLVAVTVGQVNTAGSGAPGGSAPTPAPSPAPGLVERFDIEPFSDFSVK